MTALLKLEHAGFGTPGGGNVHIVDGVSPSKIRLGQFGVGFGPLRLTPFANSTVAIDDLRFASAEKESWLPFVGMAGTVGAMAHYDRTDGEPIDPEDTRLTRRALIAGIGLSVLAVGYVRADDEMYNVAEFDLLTSERGLNLAVDDVVAAYLPDDHTFYVSVDGGSVGSFDAGGESLTINPGVEGHVQIESDEALTFLQELWADFRADDTVEYRFQPIDDSFATYTVGEEVEISDQPILVDPIDNADPSATLMSIDDTTIPHVDSYSSAAGEWYVQDGRRLVFVVGEDAPDTSLVELRINVGRLESIWNRYF